MKDYSWEFEVYTDIMDTIDVDVWRDATEEEKQMFREEGSPFIPKRIKVGTEPEEKVIKTDAVFKRRIPDIRNIIIHESFNPKGKKYKNRFIVEESNTVKYFVKGKYKKFRKILDNLDNTSNKKIGY